MFPKYCKNEIISFVLINKKELSLGENIVLILIILYCLVNFYELFQTKEILINFNTFPLILFENKSINLMLLRKIEYILFVKIIINI